MSFIDGLVKNISSTRLAVCIPARDMMHTATTYCLWQLAELLKTQGIESRLFISPGTLIANQRHELVLSAMDWKATHVLFIDSDIEFEPGAVLTLLKHKKDIVAGCYSQRQEPFVNTAWSNIGVWDTWIRINKESTGLMPIEAVALGFCLIDITVFDKIDDPWFQLGYMNGQYTGEDIEFCRNAISNNIKIHLDLDVSKRLIHLGTRGFRVIGDD